jgi:hypothetical protein
LREKVGMRGRLYKYPEIGISVMIYAPLTSILSPWERRIK